MDAPGKKEAVGEGGSWGGDLAFLVFALSHAACGDGPVEVRVGERCLIEWCPDCAKLEAFVSSPT